jgi:hypothetical protein
LESYKEECIFNEKRVGMLFFLAIFLNHSLSN